MVPPKRAVLVADGDVAVCSLIAAVAVRLNLEPAMARDARTARTLLETQTFDGAVIDLLLPGLERHALVPFLESVAPALIPRTIVTIAMPVPPEASFSGVAATVRKPFLLEELSDVLVRLCAV